MEKKPIGDAVEELKANLDTVARVYEWAELMGYKNSKLYSRHFLRHFGCRSSEVLIKVRLRSIVSMLKLNTKSCLEIAWEHSMPDEKALNSFMNRHLDTSPTNINGLSNEQLRKQIEKS